MIDQKTVNCNKKLTSKINYFDIKENDDIIAHEFVQADKGYCSFYKVTKEGSEKVHYMYTAEVSDAKTT